MLTSNPQFQRPSEPQLSAKDGRLDWDFPLDPVSHTASTDAAMVELCRSVMQTLIELLPMSARDVELATTDFAARFKQLAHSAKQQAIVTDNLIQNIGSIPTEDGTVSLQELVDISMSTLNDSMTKMIQTSEQASALVHQMDDAIRNLHEIEGFSQKIRKVTDQAKILSLNAKIEAMRAGEAGLAFGVVAEEVKSLSQAIATLSQEMGARTNVIIRKVTDGFEHLKVIAETDLSADFAAKEKLELLTESLLQMNEKSKLIMEKSVENSKEISQSINSMVIELQFQDRNSQISENATEMLKGCVHYLENTGFQHDINQAPAELASNGANQILSVIKLVQVKDMFVHHLNQSNLINYDKIYEIKSNEDVNDIDLF